MKIAKWVCMMVSVLGMTGLLQAQNYTNIVSGNWSDSASWKGNNIPPGGPTNQIYFDNDAANASVNNLGAFVLNSLTFTRGNAVTLSGNDLSFTNNGATLPKFTQNAGTPANSIANNITLATNTTFYVNVGSLANTGVVSGPSQLIKTGAATLSLAASNTYSGTTTVSAGALTVNGANGAISSPTILLNGGKLSLDNTGSGNNSRVPDTTALFLQLGGELSLTGNGTSGSTAESIGALTAGQGSSTITVAGTGSGTLQQLTVATFERADSATVLVRGTNLGQGSSNTGRFILSDISGLTFVGASTSSSGGAGTTKTLRVIPYMVADNTATGTGAGTGDGTGLATYDTVSGLRPLPPNEIASLTNTYTTAAIHENVSAYGDVQASSLAVNSLTSIYSDKTVNGANTALQIDSGVIRVPGTYKLTFNSGFSEILLGNGVWNEGNVYNVATLTINVPLNVTGNGGLVKGGAGTMILTASNLYTGVTTVNAGTLQLGNAGTSGSLSGGLALVSGTTLAYNRTDASAPIAGPVTGSGGAIVVNSGMLTLQPTNLSDSTYNTFGAVTINANKLTLNGSATSTNVFASLTSASGGKLYLQGGLQSFTGYSPASAFAYQTGGDVRLNGFMLTSSRGYYRLEGGTLSSLGLGAAGTYCAVASSGIGVLDICGGALSVLAGGGTAGFNLARGTFGTGVVYQTSGTLLIKDSENFSAIGNNNCRGEYTLAGGVCTGGVGFAWTYNNLSGTAILNLNGGTLYTKGFRWGIVSGGIDSTVNFNGGTLAASAAATGTGYAPNASDFLRTSNAFVHANGLVFDSKGYNITIAMPLQAPAGKGVTALPLLPGGTLPGYSGAPYVEISGGSGKGATGVAQFDYTIGNVTGLVITCPGVNYQSGDTVTVTLKGGGQADNVLGSATIGDIASGGLTKIGAGTLTLSGTNTFTGATMVSAGTLSLSHTNALPTIADVYITSTSSAKVNLSSGTHVIRKLYVDNVLQPKALLGAAKLPNSITGTGFFYPTQGRAGTMVTFM